MTAGSVPALPKPWRRISRSCRYHTWLRPDVDATDEVVARRVFRELGVAWFIAGSYQRVGDNLRIVAWLLDTETGVVPIRSQWMARFGELFVCRTSSLRS